MNTLPILLQLPWIQLRRRAWQPGGAAAYALIVGVAHLEGMQIRVSISLVLKLSKSGSGVWAPFPLSMDHNMEGWTPEHPSNATHTTRGKREEKEEKKKKKKEKEKEEEKEEEEEEEEKEEEKEEE